MRVRAWVRAVKLASGLGLAELEEMFSQRLGTGPSSRSCIWEKYQRGEVVPRFRLQTKRGLSLVERVEQRYPGTAKWLTSPLWRLVDKAPMEMGEIREIYEGLPYLFQSIFIAGPHEGSPLFWRRPIDPKDVCEILLKLSERDAISALVTALTMAKEAETTQDQYQHELAVECVWDCLDLLQDEPALMVGLLDELNDYLMDRWIEVEYKSS